MRIAGRLPRRAVAGFVSLAALAGCENKVESAPAPAPAAATDAPKDAPANVKDAPAKDPNQPVERSPKGSQVTGGG